MPTGSRLAAIDLGSNSFRLEIAQLEHGQLQRTEYLKETVRQGAGLDADQNLSADAMQRGWACLARFAERLAGFRPQQVRAVATQTLREARNRDVFLAQAQAILGFPIDVLSGQEEARLIYLGVSRLLPPSDERRLVLDIGGRSTELIVGQGQQAQRMASYRVGSVAWSMRYFADGVMNAQHFERAEIAAKAVLDEAACTHARAQWDMAYGCSGTVGAVADALLLAGRTQQRYAITRDGLDWLRERLIKARHFDAIRLEGIRDDRKPVAAGGLAVLRALFDLLGIDTLHYAYGALRHGALYDMLGRKQQRTDVRGAAIDALAARFSADPAQAARVARCALQLFAHIAPAAGRKSGASQPEAERQIEWAARLHEIGARISHTDSHKHGAYILGHADVAGFAMGQLHDLSQLVLGHRGKLRKMQARFDDAAFMRQLLPLRLAVILCHARTDPDSARISLQEDGARKFRLRLPPGWASAWPQSAHLLHEEAAAWQKTPWRLRLDEGKKAPA